MRVIAGEFRGRTLKGPPSLRTRPTSDRLRETLFNILAPRIEGARFLDLCAGSGAVGIEALSRGAAHVTFVDRSRKMCELIKANLNLCGVSDQVADVVQAHATDFVRRAVKRLAAPQAHKPRPWDVIFFDPPYGSDYAPLLKILGEHDSEFVTKDGSLIVEHHHKTDLKEAFGRLRRLRVLKQGESRLSFYARG